MSYNRTDTHTHTHTRAEGHSSLQIKMERTVMVR